MKVASNRARLQSSKPNAIKGLLYMHPGLTHSTQFKLTNQNPKKKSVSPLSKLKKQFKEDFIENGSGYEKVSERQDFNIYSDRSASLERVCQEEQRV